MEKLDKPQDVSKIIKFIERESLSFSYFIICGTGTESKTFKIILKKQYKKHYCLRI